MTLKMIPVEKIIEGKNVRIAKDEELGELIKSVEKYDILQPVLVIPRDGKYELVTGHRRLAAIRAMGEPFVPCMVRDDISDGDVPMMKLVENVQRKQMSPMELVTIFDEMIRKIPGTTKSSIARMLGKSPSWVQFKYTATRGFEALLEAGLTEEMISDMTENELAKMAKKGRRGRPKKNAPEKKGGLGRIDKRAGFGVLVRGTDVLVKCESIEVRKKIVNELYRFKKKLEEK
jgi:ParB/RepB/Spo0J family partition protein